MPLTRTHIAFLGIISIFTGIIGPGVRAGSEMLSYLMTDMRALAYGMLIALILAFFLAALRKWRLYRICIVLIILSIITLAILTATLPLESIKTEVVVTGVSWAWVFLILGGLLLAISYRHREISEEESSYSDAIDTVIGMIGGFALACIAGILILSSLSFFGRGQSHDILRDIYTSGELRVLSGGIMVGDISSKTEPQIIYDRGADRLLTTITSASGNLWKLSTSQGTWTGSVRDGLRPFLIGDTLYMRDSSGYAYSGETLMLGSRVSEGDEMILYKSDKRVLAIHSDGMITTPYSGGIISTPISLSGDQKSVLWTEIKNGKEYVIKNGLAHGDASDDIYTLSLSQNGESDMVLALSGADTIVMKDGRLVHTLSADVLTGSYISNGAHFLYLTEKNGIKKVLHDMLPVSRDLESVRETFLEKDGGSYMYFGQPLGEKYYCLFTRYKGNLCGLEAYMNPILGADGTSIIFAGKKDGIWSIYRNSDVIVRNTGYKGNDIVYDYAYYDATNPRAYLFIIYDKSTQTYTYLKNGSILPGVWSDISTKVSFGYDNHIITSAKDDTGWRIVEL